EVEVAVAEAHLLAHLSREGLDLERRRVRVREELGVGDPDLHLAGRQLLVDRLGRALDDGSPGAQDILRAELVAELEGVARLVRVEDELDEPGPVAEVDEDEAAVVAATVDPAGHAQLRVHPVGQHLPAPGVAVAIGPKRREILAHGGESVSTSVAGSTSRSSPESMSRMVAFPCSERISA